MRIINSKVTTWSLVIIMIVFTCSCDKKWPINGNLDGYWQLMTVETKTDGTKKDCHRMYIGIQLHMIELKDLGNNGYESFFGEFNYNEDEDIVIIKNLKEKSSTSDNGKVADITDLNPYGINALETGFKVVKADGKTLILESNYARLTMRSF